MFIDKCVKIYVNYFNTHQLDIDDIMFSNVLINAADILQKQQEFNEAIIYANRSLKLTYIYY